MSSSLEPWSDFRRCFRLRLHVQEGKGLGQSVPYLPVLPICWYFSDVENLVMAEVPSGIEFGNHGNP